MNKVLQILAKGRDLYDPYLTDVKKDPEVYCWEVCDVSSVEKTHFRLIKDCSAVYCNEVHPDEDDCNCEIMEYKTECGDYNNDYDRCDGFGRCRRYNICNPNVPGEVHKDKIFNQFVKKIKNFRVMYPDGSGMTKEEKNMMEHTDNTIIHVGRTTYYTNPVDVYFLEKMIDACLRKKSNKEGMISCNDVYDFCVTCEYYGDECGLRFKDVFISEIFNLLETSNYLDVENNGWKFNINGAYLAKINIDDVIIIYPSHLRKVDPVEAPHFMEGKWGRGNSNPNPWNEIQITGVLNSKGELVDGYHRFLAAQNSGKKVITVIILDKDDGGSAALGCEAPNNITKKTTNDTKMTNDDEVIEEKEKLIEEKMKLIEEKMKLVEEKMKLIEEKEKRASSA